MKTTLRQGWSFILGIAALAFAGAADATSIGGLNPMQPVTIENTVPSVVDGTMHIGAADTGAISITAWPRFLPQRFGKQSVIGTRQLHPAGPVDKVSFSRSAEPSPWLLIGNGARRATTLIGQWQLQLSGGRWIVADGTTKKALGSSVDTKPVMLKVGTERWCLYLLDAVHPEAQPHIAKEAEPQISWAAIRLHQLQKKCTAPK